jgi:hypothetical protein
MSTAKKIFAENAVKKFVKEISSGIAVDLAELKSRHPLVILKSHIKTRIVLNQTETIFEDFTRKGFPEYAIASYQLIRDSLSKQNKTNLITLLSYPLHTFIMNAEQRNLALPFAFYPEVTSAKLLHGILRL